MTISSELSMFAPVKGALAMLLTNGVYKTVPVYSYAGKLYAEAKGGYIRLLAQQLTSVRGLNWRAIEGVSFIEAHDGLHCLPELEEKDTKKALRAAARTRASKLADMSRVQ